MRHLFRRSAGLARRRGQRRAAAMSSCMLLLVVSLLVAGCASTTASGQATPASHTTPVGQPIPTATASAPSSPLAAALAARARQAIGSLGSDVAATYDATQAAATITVTVAGNVPMTDAQVAAAYSLIKDICYWAFSATWSSGVPLNAETIIVVGPIQDEYDDIVTDWYGLAMVKAGAAQQIRWPSLTPSSAWGLYTQGMLRSSFELFD